MVFRIIIFPGIYPTSGIGNVYRMLALANHLRLNNPTLEIDFITKDTKRIAKVFENNAFNLIDFNGLTKYYDVALYDSSRYEEFLLTKLRLRSKEIICFDFFNYDTNLVDTIINLFNHFPERVKLFKGKIFSGLEYAILNEKIITSKTTFTNYNDSITNSFLITFGGEDPKGNTLIVLKALINLQLNGTVLVGKLNKFKKEIHHKFKEQFHILDQVQNIEKYFSINNAVICGGGTTLLESLYLGKPTIAIAQNINEANFIDSIKQSIKIFTLDEVTDIIEIIKDRTQKDLLFEKYTSIIDGKGKERITNIIYKKFQLR